MKLEKQRTFIIKTEKKAVGKSVQNTVIFTVGSVGYSLIEILWRGYTHWSMTITGGVCLVVLYRLYSNMPQKCLFKKCLTGAVVITGIEFIVGCIVNLWWQMNVWDYSFLPFNVLGQICLPYSILWGLLSLPICGICNHLKGKFSK